MTIEPNYIKKLEKQNEKLQNLLHVEQMNGNESDYLISNLKEENQKLKQDLLRAEAMEDYWKIHSSELEEDITQLKEELYYCSDEITELKTKLYDVTVKEQRLLKILNETDDYT